MNNMKVNLPICAQPNCSHNIKIYDDFPTPSIYCEEHQDRKAIQLLEQLRTLRTEFFKKRERDIE